MPTLRSTTLTGGGRLQITPKKITIEVSAATHAKLCGLEEKVAEILRIPASRVSHEQIILIAIALKSMDEALVDLALQA